MAKQIVLHYAGSYVERPHTITFDSEREYLDFIKNKGYKLKPNVEYGVFTLNAILSTQFQQSTIKVEDVSEADKPDIPTITPPTIDIKYPQCCCSDEKEKEGNNNNININITIPGLEGVTGNQGNVNVDTGNNQGTGNTNPPKDDEENKDNPPVVNPPVEITPDSPKVNVDNLAEEEAKNNLNSVNVGFDRVSNVITITGDIDDLQAYPSSDPTQGDGKWIPLKIVTGLPTIVGAKVDGVELTDKDRQEALGLGMAEGSFVLWVNATENYDRNIVIEKDGVSKTIKVKFNNTGTQVPEDGGDIDNPQPPTTNGDGEEGEENGEGTEPPTVTPEGDKEENTEQTDPVVPPTPPTDEGEDNTDQGSDSEIIIPDEGGSSAGDDDVIVL